MKLLSETKALERLTTLISNFKSEISDNYEHLAKSCDTCDVKGSCCLDVHFVNVHISRLEAVGVRRALNALPTEIRDRVAARIDESIVRYELKHEGDTYIQTYACPLFEKGVGCLIHHTGKPVACIAHACYESRADLPPIELQHRAERTIDDLNAQTYGRHDAWLPLPLALRTY